jgi:Zn-dependent protease
MTGRSFRIARIAGIPVGVSPWWLGIVVLLSWVLGGSYFPDSVAGLAPAAGYALGLASVLLLFASILLHEFGHALVARRSGIEVEEIDLWLLGGVAKLRGEAHDPRDELRYALAGPLVTAVVVVLFGALAAVVGTGSTVLGALVRYQLFVNAAILLFNLIPAFPLDGGRVLRSLLWLRFGDLSRATAVAAATGRVFGAGMIALGVLALLVGALDGLWLAVVGMFVFAAAGAQSRSVAVDTTLAGVRAGELMSAPAEVLAAGTPVDQAIAEQFAQARHVAFPIVEADATVIGLLTLDRVERLSPPAHRPPLRVADIADRDPGLIAHEEDDVTLLLRRPAFQRVGRLAIVDPDGAAVGLLSITDVERALRAARLAPRERTTPPARGFGAPTGRHG